MTQRGGVIAHFTPEIALDQSLHTYSGGLGVYSGGFLMSARKLGLPMVGVSILPRQGYYDQYFDIAQQKMGIRYVCREYDGLLEDTGLLFPIDICAHSVWIRVWKLSECVFGSSPVYFLDADIKENDLLSRSNTLQLYGGSRDSGANAERKIAQSIILGKGGVEALRRLDIPVKLYHLNESHCAFAALTLLECAHDNILDVVRQQIVFTTHTPVSAGNPEYRLETVAKMLGSKTLHSDYLRSIGGDPFNMAVVCLKLSRKANAVSHKHLTVAEKMWHWVDGCAPLVGITNGVNQDYWQLSHFKNANDISELATAKRHYKRELVELVQKETGACLSEHLCTIVWARRFAEYKRPKLLLSDLDWLRAHLKSNNFQVIFAGRPHPDDYEMIDTWNHIYALSKELPNLVMLPGYELQLSLVLKRGADVWLNTPRAPNEACGTSGMSAAMNGAINLSTPDGWMAEANPENCFLFGSPFSTPSQDALDTQKLKERIDKIIPIFNFEKDAWYQKALAAKLEAETHWTSDRMVKEYAALLYT